MTTADVFDATPAANAVHTSNRGNGTGIADQYLDDRNLTGLSVLMGGRPQMLHNAAVRTIMCFLATSLLAGVLQ